MSNNNNLDNSAEKNMKRKKTPFNKRTITETNLNIKKGEKTVEDEIDDITKAMEDNHIHRLEAGICGADVGAQYLSLSSNAERVADHLINVGKTIRKITN